MSLKNALFLSALAVLAPLASANRLFVNGTCVGGDSCPPPLANANPILFGGSDTGSGSAPFTVGGDPFLITWTFNDFYDAGGTNVVIDPVVTYTGASPLAVTRNVTVLFYQEFFDASPGTWNGDYTETAALFADTNSSVSAQLCLGTWVAQLDCLATIGPVVGPSTFTGTDTQTFNNLPFNDLVYRYEFDFTFSPGATFDSSAGAVPEPVEALPLGVALLGLAGYKYNRRRKGTNSAPGGDALA